MKRIMPLLLTILGVAIVGSIALYRLMHFQGRSSHLVLMALVTVEYLSWLAWESKISVREIEQSVAEHDGGTMELAAACKILLLINALVWPAIWTSAAWLGPVVLAAGVLMRTSAIREIGKDYSHRIRIPGAGVIASGMFSKIRHPAYLGTILAHTGVVLVFMNAGSIALLAAWFGVVAYRALVEDRFLLANVKAYSEYAGKVRYRLIPGIW